MTDQQTDLSPRELNAAIAERMGWIEHEQRIGGRETWKTPDGRYFPRIIGFFATGDGMLLVLEEIRKRSSAVRAAFDDWMHNKRCDDRLDYVDVITPENVVSAALDAMEKE